MVKFGICETSLHIEQTRMKVKTRLGGCLKEAEFPGKRDILERIITTSVPSTRQVVRGKDLIRTQLLTRYGR